MQLTEWPLLYLSWLKPPPLQSTTITQDGFGGGEPQMFIVARLYSKQQRSTCANI